MVVVLIVLHFPCVSLMVRGVPLDESCLGPFPSPRASTAALRPGIGGGNAIAQLLAFLGIWGLILGLHYGTTVHYAYAKSIQKRSWFATSPACMELLISFKMIPAACGNPGHASGAESS